MPVHQPADHQDDEEQAEYAADFDRPAATMIAAAIVPKAASEQNKQQHDQKNQSHRFVFHQFGNPCRAAVAGSFIARPVEPAVQWQPSLMNRP